MQCGGNNVVGPRPRLLLVLDRDKTTMDDLPYHEFDLSALPVSFGRHPGPPPSKRGWNNNTLRVSRDHLHILEPTAKERASGVAVKVIDQSYNGTLIDNKLIPKRRAVPVQVGQLIVLGPVAYRLVLAQSPLDSYLDKHAPEELLCPISLCLLEDPVILAADGITYSRASIQKHFDSCRTDGKPLTSPKTNIVIIEPVLEMLIPNVLVRSMVLEYKETKAKDFEATR